MQGIEMPPVACIQGHPGFAASENLRTLICIARASYLLPVESLRAAEVTEAGVPQSCREALLLCSAQVREGRTSLAPVIMVHKHLLIG